PYVLIQRGRGRAASPPSGRRAIDTNFVTIPRDTPPAHFKADQLTADALLLLTQQRFPSDEFALVELHDPAQVRLERRNGRVNLVAVQGHFGFQAQRVPRAQTARLDSELPAGFEDFVPDPGGLARGDVNLNSVFARIAGARDPRRGSGDFSIRKPIIANFVQLDSSQLP